MARAFTATQYLSGTTPVTDYPFTFAGWSYPTNTTAGSATKSILGISDNSVTTRFSYLGWKDSATSQLELSTSMSGVARTYATTAFATLNTWQHVAAVLTSSTDQICYINGDSTGSYGLTGSPSFGAVNTVSLGALVRSTVIAPYYGNLAEFGLWNVALTQAEIDQLAAGYSPLMIRPQSLVGYWPLHGRSTTEEDWVGAATLTNTSSTTADHPPIIYPKRQIWVPVSAGGGGATDLTIQDATHGHTADSPTITVASSLAIQDATHAHAADSPTLSLGYVDLAIADAAHAHTADNLTISVSGATDLVIQDATHGHSADSPTLTLGYVDLVIQEALHAHTADNLTLGGLYTDLELILKILSNRQELNAGTGTFTIYDDDSVSVLFTANAWADAAGTVPYSGGTLGRIDALA